MISARAAANGVAAAGLAGAASSVTGPTGPTGSTGPTGPTGPTGTGARIPVIAAAFVETLVSTPPVFLSNKGFVSVTMPTTGDYFLRLAGTPPPDANCVVEVSALVANNGGFIPEVNVVRAHQKNVLVVLPRNHGVAAIHLPRKQRHAFVLCFRAVQ